MECKNANSNPSCTCTYTSCSRHGICCECITYHRKTGQMVGCYFPKMLKELMIGL
ncbi:MAG: DUF6485 family protein [Cyanobacteriota bacterium]